MKQNDMNLLKKARSQGFRAGLDLAAAIQNAGGSVDSIAGAIREGMTVEDFVCSIAAQNGIQFTYSAVRGLDAQDDDIPY